MNIVIESIKAHNFLSYEDFEIDFKDLGFVQISGTNNKVSDTSKSNGAGKSAIFEAICYTLTGETIRGITNVVRDGDNDGCYLELSARFNSSNFLIKRSLRHKEFGTNLKIYVNGEDKSGKGIRDSKKILSELLPDLTPNLVGSIVVLGQGLPFRFTNNSPSGRKEVLEKLTKSDFMIEDIKLRVVNRETDLLEKQYNSQRNLDRLQVEKTSLENELDRLKKMVSSCEDVQELEARLVNKQNELKSYEDKLADVKTEENIRFNLYDSLRNQLSELNERHRSSTYELKEKFSNDTRTTEKEKARLIAELNSKRKEYNKLASVKDTCPTCGQKLIGVKLPSLEPVIGEISSIEQTIADVDSLLESEKEEFSKNLETIEKDYAEEKVSYESMISTAELDYCDSSSVRREVESSIFELNKEISSIESRLSNSRYIATEGKKNIKEYEIKIHSVTESIENEESSIGELNERLIAIRKIKTLTSRDFRGYLLRNVISYLKNILNNYSKIVYENQCVDVSADGNDLNVFVGDRQYEQLSGGERQKVDIILQLALREMLCKLYGYSCNIVCMDEIFDNLDSIGCEKILELISKELSDVEDVFIVTHHEDLQLPCDRKIEVEKDEKGVSHLWIHS